MITAAMVAELRHRTDAPLLVCKTALLATDCDMDSAETMIRLNRVPNPETFLLDKAIRDIQRRLTAIEAHLGINQK